MPILRRRAIAGVAAAPFIAGAARASASKAFLIGTAGLALGRRVAGQQRRQLVGGVAAIVAVPHLLDPPRADVLDRAAVHLERLPGDSGRIG